ARLARLRALVPLSNAIVGIDLADKKQMVVVCDHDSRVLARKTFRCRAGDLGRALDWAAGGATGKGFRGVTVACDPPGHRRRVLGQRAAGRGMPFVRMVVRRPTDPKNFNGTVVVEWYNVTVGFDVEANWFRYHEEIVRAGFAWVGISAQRVGVNALRSWSPNRYGSLDVNQGGAISNDGLAWDIYCQALQALKQPEGLNPLGNLQVKRIIADGESSSASKLTQYYNAIQPLAGVADAFIMNGPPAPNILVRTDLATPAFRLQTETDIAVIGGAQ